MSARGFTGISFPFRINGKGSVETSTTGPSDVTHIAESIAQIFGTAPKSRVHEPRIGAASQSVIFGNMDEVRKAQFKSEAIAGAAQDKRVALEEREVTEKPEDGILEMSVGFVVRQTMAAGRVNVERRVE